MPDQRIFTHPYPGVMKIRHAEAVSQNLMIRFFSLSQSRKDAKLFFCLSLRLCGFARDVFFQWNKNGINVFS
jgi:hypothetical protein